MSFQWDDIRSRGKKAAESVKSFVRLLHEKNILKGLRISYKVVWNLFLIFIVFGLMAAFFAIGAGAGYFASLVKDQEILSREQMKKSIYSYTETSEIYFAHHVYLGKMPTSLRREEVDLEDVSKHVINALIATEDQYFYKHVGVVPKATMRALYQELSNAPIVTGGSTLTQQLVKNQILTPEVSFKRKAKEMLYAMRIERFFKKNQILEAYLNVVPFGRNASGQNIAGIQAAARGVFGVDADELNLPQAAYLAGMPKNPFSYTPFKNTGGVKEDISAGIERMHTVLERMLNAGFITKKQYEKALDYNIRKHLTDPEQSTFERYPSLTMEIKRRATEIIAKKIAEKQGHNGDQLAKNADLYERYRYEKNHPNLAMTEKLKEHAQQLKKDWELFNRYLDIAGKQISRSGYKIYTTIDKKVFDALQKVAHAYEDYGPKRTYYNEYTNKYDINPETGKKKKYLQQVAAMLIENDTGAIIGFVPGRDYEKMQFNLATQALRSNGSTMKPLLVYGPAIEMGIAQPGSIVADLPFSYRNGESVDNFGHNYHGLESVRRALYLSHNIPAVKTYTKAMNQGNPRTFLKKMGVTSIVGANHQSLAIGSLHRGISVEENTNAFATFANGGKFIDAYMIRKIVDAEGNVIYKHHSDPVPVFSPQTSYLVIDILRDVLERGTATAIPPRLDFYTDWAGKTGTSQNVYDEWFVGTNPNVTLGVWTGYAKQIAMDYSSAAHRTQELWAKFANAAYEIRPELMDPEERFHMPSGIVRRTVCKISGMLPSDLCSAVGLTLSDLFIAKYAPNEVGHVLDKGRYVVVNGEKYIAHKNTPKAFTEKGVLINEEFITEHYLSVTMEELFKYDRYYRSKAWQENVIPAKELEENGKRPAPVGGVRINGRKLTWNTHPESDIVGYRIYAARKGAKTFTKIGAVKAYKNHSFPIHPGAFAYYVTAVDIEGQESAKSKIVKSGNWTKPDKPKKPNDGGGDNGGDGGGKNGGDGDNGGGNGDGGPTTEAGGGNEEKPDGGEPETGTDEHTSVSDDTENKQTSGP